MLSNYEYDVKYSTKQLKDNNTIKFCCRDTL